jgi:hypothetical protein
LPDATIVGELGSMLFAATDTTGNTLRYALVLSEVKFLEVLLYVKVQT